MGYRWTGGCVGVGSEAVVIGGVRKRSITRGGIGGVTGGAIGRCLEVSWQDDQTWTAGGLQLDELDWSGAQLWLQPTLESSSVQMNVRLVCAECT